MTEFAGTLFDGESLRGAEVSATFTVDGNLHIRQADDGRIIPLAAVRVSDRIGSMPRFLRLPDGGTIETADNDAIDAMLSRARRGRLTALIHLLESHSRVAAAATVLLIASVVICLKYGLPALAAQTAMKVPAAIEAEAGQAALAALQPFLGGVAPEPAGATQGTAAAQAPHPGPPLRAATQALFLLDGTVPQRLRPAREHHRGRR